MEDDYGSRLEPPEVDEPAWSPVLNEAEFIDPRALTRFRLQQEKLGKSKKKQGWNYEYEAAPNGRMTLEGVQHAPYHTLLSNLAFHHLKEIFVPDRSIVLKNGRSSWVHVFDLMKGEPRPAPEFAKCSVLNNEYEVESLERLRSKILTSSVIPSARLIVVEEILPPVMEILGRTCGLPAHFFKRHIGRSWGGLDDSVRLVVNSNMQISNGTISFMLPQPAILPIIYRNRKPIAQEMVLRHATKGLQEDKVWPILEPDDYRTYTAAFQHLTVMIQYSSQGSWRGVILVPPNVRGLEYNRESVRSRSYNTKGFDTTLGLARRENFEPLDFPTQITDGEMAENWASLVEDASHGGLDLLDPLAIVTSLVSKALDRWSVHLTHVTRAVELVMPNRRRGPSVSLLNPQQSLRAIIIKDMMLMADVLDTLKTIQSTCNLKSSVNSFSRPNDEELLSVLETLKDRCTTLLAAFERLLPTIQHEIDVLVVEQQVNLAQTQLEESRKGIQQADTIKRLTILAFIYVPIQTAASLFGMNISELLTDAPSVWKFAVTAVILLLTTVSAAGWLQIAPVLEKWLPSRLFVRGVTAGTRAGAKLTRTHRTDSFPIDRLERGPPVAPVTEPSSANPDGPGGS